MSFSSAVPFDRQGLNSNRLLKKPAMALLAVGQIVAAMFRNFCGFGTSPAGRAIAGYSTQLDASSNRLPRSAVSSVRNWNPNRITTKRSELLAHLRVIETTN
jgi:hypothetical protein